MSMTSLNISLPTILKTFAEEQVSLGGYTSVSEYFRELIRADQRQKAEGKLEALLLEGVNSGPLLTTTEQDWEEHRTRLKARIAEKSKKQ